MKNLGGIQEKVLCGRVGSPDYISARNGMLNLPSTIA